MEKVTHFLDAGWLCRGSPEWENIFSLNSNFLLGEGREESLLALPLSSATTKTVSYFILRIQPKAFFLSYIPRPFACLFFLNQDLAM